MADTACLPLVTGLGRTIVQQQIHEPVMHRTCDPKPSILKLDNKTHGVRA